MLKTLRIATGGTIGYQYLWNDSLHQTSNMAENLNAFQNELETKTYHVGISDAHGCTITGSAQLINPEKMVIHFNKDSSTVCVGQTIKLDAKNEGATYTWKKDEANFSTQREISIYQDGNYSVKAISEKGCIAEASYKLRTSTSLLKAQFLATDTMYVGDTLLIAEISKLPETGEYSSPDSIRWKKSNENLNIFQMSGHQREHYFFVAEDTGSVSLEMTAYMGQCLDNFTNNFIVLPKKNESNFRTFGYVEIRSHKLFPNPVTGKAHLHIELSDNQDINVSIAHSVNIQVLNTFSGEGKSIYDFEADLSHYVDGMYLVYIKTASTNKVLKIIKN